MRIGIVGTTAFSLICFRSDLISDLVRRGHEVYAFAIDFDDKTSATIENLGAVPVGYKIDRSGFNILSDFKNTLALSLTFRRLSLDLVFCYFAKPVIFGTIAAVLAGVPKRFAMVEGLGFVFTDSGYSAVSFKKIILKFFVRLLYGFSFLFCNRIIFLNNDDPVDLLGGRSMFFNKIVVIDGIGVDLDIYCYSPAPVEKIVFLFVGRLLFEKGIREFISAADWVGKIFPEVEFYAVGGVDLANPSSLSMEDIRNYEINHSVRFVGHVGDVKDWIVRSSVFVLPSYREGLPRSTQEAMAIGRPIITTDVPGCRETVENGVNGFLVPPFSCRAIANKMIYFIENPSEIRRMGESSYLTAKKRFDVFNINEKLVNVLFSGLV